jgi:hypothetical protein
MMFAPSSDDKLPPRGRQRPGAACEEFRRRKLRCHGQQPQCGVCLESGVVCEVNTFRAPRGPKKGYFKALTSRIGSSFKDPDEENGADRDRDLSQLR